MNSSATIERLEKFIPSIAGISASNRQGLLHIVGLLKQEQAARDEERWGAEDDVESGLADADLNAAVL